MPEGADRHPARCHRRLDKVLSFRYELRAVAVRRHAPAIKLDPLGVLDRPPKLTLRVHRLVVRADAKRAHSVLSTHGASSATLRLFAR